MNIKSTYMIISSCQTIVIKILQYTMWGGGGGGGVGRG